MKHSGPVLLLLPVYLVVGGFAVSTLAQPPLIAGRTDQQANLIGRELSTPHRLDDGAEFTIPLRDLLAHGERLFTAVWTGQEGGGRPLSKGTGAPLANINRPLQFPRNFNRVSAPDANACSGCHNFPVVGGDGDIVANVFVLGQRFDFATFQATDLGPTIGAFDESGAPVSLESIANSRATVGMSGSGYIELLAIQMTRDLQAIRDSIPPGAGAALSSRGVDFGQLARQADGRWDVSDVQGLVAPSLQSTGRGDPPSLIIRPFHQASSVISLRQFTNNAFNHHHGMQSAERFGAIDADGDGFYEELTRAEITAVTLFQAVMAVPGRVIPNDGRVEAAVLEGERLFDAIGCASCHVASLPLDRGGARFIEPNPFNPPGNLRPGDAQELTVDLTRNDLPQPRLRPGPRGIVDVPAFTDLKVHDICDGPDDPGREALDMNEAAGTPAFFAGNCRFITRRLWGVASTPPYFHHGKFTTLREAILAHGGEAAAQRSAFQSLRPDERDAVIEFLKTLQILPPDTPHLVIDERGRPKSWPPAR